MAASDRLSVTERLKRVQHEISELQRSLKTPKSVTVIAVSKKQPREAIVEAFEQGQLDFGENYVPDLVERSTWAGLSGVRWHFIGHLQTNKCNKLCSVPNLFAVQSVDSVKLATALNTSWSRHRAERGRPLEVYVQVNTSGEGSKSGMAPGAACEELVKHITDSCEALRFRGLMTIGSVAQSVGDGPNEDFSRLQAHRGRLCSRLPHLEAASVQLNMGMSADYAEAIRQGADVVRIGSAIFGHRP